jgi:acyl carrier protein
MPASDAAFPALAETLRAVCRDRLIGLAPDTALDDVPGLDSLALIQAVALMEDRFQVDVETTALGDMRRIADILRLIAAARPRSG